MITTCYCIIIIRGTEIGYDLRYHVLYLVWYHILYDEQYDQLYDQLYDELYDGMSCVVVMMATIRGMSTWGISLHKRLS